MIFVCVGSRHYPFDRLFKKLDELIEQGLIDEEIFAQIGTSKYIPRHFAYKDFLNRDEFESKIDEAQIVISHGATGSFIQALNKGKQVIGVTRLARYGEHIDDHQIQTNEAFAENKYILAVFEIDELYDAIKSYKDGTADVVKWENLNPNAIIDLIDGFIQENLK
ncbi:MULTISPECIES: PssE/Cps14G family polysaccharide biosynthesis glycosyltransferase [unclassified Dehalobacter]|uniref:PssE/Cps14G family polysaccharide biosynthesis glycosyltransferase n=1 Tax=unclassified Dehalobacter TaxID=2635733 RepID=UPI000379044C|nr:MULTISPECIES: PssE/Cps14G family polysaccharide biosynthesis glycosyltransferase [unclassified Dehalobacter]RJE48980.1 glycosyl transferase [Dehalobacter sp. MCB1]TCX51718.1 glycosyl transferase [Dehalobacter sp. 14DCB1]TCX52778.1 glycosyl transferase [Dehalobacter sp. 12DCB1]